MTKREHFEQQMREEVKIFKMYLKTKGYPVDDVWLDTDFYKQGEPYLDVHIELDEDWFYNLADEKAGL